jgi:hypothetical protein
MCILYLLDIEKMLQNDYFAHKNRLRYSTERTVFIFQCESGPGFHSHISTGTLILELDQAG